MFTITNTQTGETVELTQEQIGSAWLAIMMRSADERANGLTATADFISEIANKLHAVNFN